MRPSTRAGLLRHRTLAASSYLKFRTFDGVDDIVDSTLGDLAGDATGTMTIAWCGKLYGTFPSDAEILSTPGYSPVDLYINAFWDRVEFYDGSTGSVGPNLSASHGTVIIVFARDQTNASEWSYYRFDTNTWSHTTSTTLTANPSFASAPGSITHGSGPGTPVNAEFVCSAIWTGTKLTQTQKETLDNSFAAWTSLSPTVAWRYDQTSPGASVVGSTSQTSITGTTLTTTDSPLLVS